MNNHTAQTTFSFYLSRIALWLVILFFILYSVLPFYWALNTSLKTPQEVAATPISYFPAIPTLDNYASALGNQEFLQSILNSALVSGGATLISLLVGGLAAYAIGRYGFRGRSLMRYVILLMGLFPTIAILPSLWATISDLGLSDNILSLIITYPLFTLPTATMPMIVFFQSLPPDIEQAAYIDGASTFQLFYKVLLPLSMPVILSAGLITFVVTWSEYLLALSFVAASPASRTVTVAIRFLRSQLTAGELMAASVILSVPLILVIFFTQRHAIRNTTQGAVKG